jgi:hypothetical protein
MADLDFGLTPAEEGCSLSGLNPIMPPECEPRCGHVDGIRSTGDKSCSHLHFRYFFSRFFGSFALGKQFVFSRTEISDF